MAEPKEFEHRLHGLRGLRGLEAFQGPELEHFWIHFCASVIRSVFLQVARKGVANGDASVKETCKSVISSRDWQDQKLLILWNRSSNQIEWWRQARQVLTANTVSSYMLCILRSESKSAVHVPFRLSPADCVSTTCNCVFAAGTVALAPSTLWNKPSSRAKHNSVETFGDLPRSWQQLYLRNVAEILQTSWCLAPKG